MDVFGTSEENSQDCIVTPIWKDTSYFDSTTKDVENGEPKTADDSQKQVKDGPNNENTEQESPDVTNGSLKLNVVGPSVNTASTNEQESTEKNQYTVNQLDKKNDKTTWLTRVSQLMIEPTSIYKALSNSSWVEAMQEELLQFKLQQVGDADDVDSEKFLDTERQPTLGFGFPGILHLNTSDRKSKLEVVSFWKTVVAMDKYLDTKPLLDSRKSTTGGCQFLRKRLTSWQCKKQAIVANSTTEVEYVAAANCYGQKPIIVPSSYQPKKTHKPRKAIRTTEISQSSGPINLVADETVYKDWEDKMERVATTASSLDAEQDSGSGPRCQDSILGGADAQTRFETASKQSNDPPLSRGYTFGSGEDSIKLLELIELCTKIVRFGEQKEKRDVKEILCEELIDHRSPFWKEIEVNAGNSNFMLLVLVTAAGLLTTVRHNIVLSV
ncbi:hypothetical protein Tco_1060577 [Tanacetum coccineum]